MTPEQEERLRVLPGLIAREKNVRSVEILAAELENLLTLQIDELKRRDKFRD